MIRVDATEVRDCRVARVLALPARPEALREPVQFLAWVEVDQWIFCVAYETRQIAVVGVQRRAQPRLERVVVAQVQVRGSDELEAVPPDVPLRVRSEACLDAQTDRPEVTPALVWAGRRQSAAEYRREVVRVDGVGRRLRVFGQCGGPGHWAVLSGAGGAARGKGRARSGAPARGGVVLVYGLFLGAEKGFLGR